MIMSSKLQRKGITSRQKGLWLWAEKHEKKCGRSQRKPVGRL